MRRFPRSLSFALAVLLLITARSAFALDEDTRVDIAHAKLTNPQFLHELQTSSPCPPKDTVYFGYVPRNVSPANYWGIGRGAFRPGSTIPADFGYWSWDNDPGFVPGNIFAGDHITEAHGDSLFGWWPYRMVYTETGGLTLPDDQRPWWAIDFGNNANYTINQGDATNPNHPGVTLKRTFGVVGVWHTDNGVGSGIGWTPLGGSFSLWCGLRKPGDLAFQDPETKNYFNGDVLQYNGVNSASTGTNQTWPGYASQWDQMAYRDIATPAGTTIVLRYKYRTNMSRGLATSPDIKTGWFAKDPLAVLPGNFISATAAGGAAPIDSLMNYVGAPVGYAKGSNFVGSDGVTHQVFDPQRRWFSEVLRVNEPAIPYYELHATAGNDVAFSSTYFVCSSVTVPAAWGGTSRIVFRVKTNRGFDDGSGTSVYTSGGAGAAVIDDVEISLNSGAFVSIGNFETPQVNNSVGVTPLTSWKTTGKPPTIYHRVASIDQLVYEDLCGPPNSPTRICNMFGNVISATTKDGDPAQFTSEQERMDGIISPTLNLLNSGVAPNAMGVTDAIARVTEDYYAVYDIYTGMFDLSNQGNAWRVGWQCYPAASGSAIPQWSDWHFPNAVLYDPDKQCFQDWEGALINGLLRWSPTLAQNGTAYPDSIRMMLGKVQECFRFGVTLGCSPADGGYWDDVAFAFVNGATSPLSVDPWQFINDAFPQNGPARSTNFLLGSNFDTTTAIVKTGLNIAEAAGSTQRFDVPGDSMVANADGANIRVDLVFRINPGPGNYVTAGVKASGLRKVPTSPTVASSGNTSNFWENYLNNNGLEGTPGGHPAGGPNGRTWSPLVWNSARCDTAEMNLWPIQPRSIGGPKAGHWMSMYNEADPKFTTLGIAKNRCFLLTAPSSVTFANMTCDISATDGWPVTAGYVSENGLPFGQTLEYTKIIPDGQLTPGSHMEYFFRREDVGNGGVAYLCPDTNLVFPQIGEGSLDAHRWQQFGVLPDTWKKVSYGGLGSACLLYIDMDDRRGDERVWVSAADSIGATRAADRGVHNGWYRYGGAGACVNDPSYYVRSLNRQPGTVWDMYGVKASESLVSKAGSIGSWYTNHTASQVNSKWSSQGPSHEMLNAFYPVLAYFTGDISRQLLGPERDYPSDDVGVLKMFIESSGSLTPRDLWVQGGAFASSAATTGATTFLQNDLKLTLRDPSYAILSLNTASTADLPVFAPISSTSDIYGIRNDCMFKNEVYDLVPGGTDAAEYSPAGSATPPVIADVYHLPVVTPPEFWHSLVSGFDIQNVDGRFCATDFGRNAYMYKVMLNVFSNTCSLTGSPGGTTDVPHTDTGPSFVDFLSLRNNPMVSDPTQISFGVSKAGRVTVRIYDIAGRVIRTLADRRFTPGNYLLAWDGADDSGHEVPRGVYFTRTQYESTGFVGSKKLIVLR